MNPIHSIRNKLLLWIGGAFLGTILVALPAGLYFSLSEINEVYDVRLINSAKAIAQVMNFAGIADDASTIIIDRPATHITTEYQEKLGYRIWLGKRLVAQSPSTFSFFGPPGPAGFSDRRDEQWTWRLFVLNIPHRNITVEVSERSDIRAELTTKLITALALPWLVLIPAISLIIWYVIRASLKPVVDISNDVDARNNTELMPINERGIPLEISPLIRALNRLFMRLHEGMQRERDFTDHAAHELRTPLAAMKTQTQVLMENAAQYPACQSSLENLHATIDRSAHLVDQLLSFSQIQSDSVVATRLNLSHCIYASINEIARIAAWKKIALSVMIAEDVYVAGQQVDLTMLFKNLIDNAVKYTPPQGQVLISLTQQGLFHVVDTGVGLSDADKKRAFDRFVRSDRTGQPGSGLGLSIVQQIAIQHGVDVTLYDNRPRGLIVEIQWPVIAQGLEMRATASPNPAIRL